jgi:two-component system KDP operon response regulator KdpE
MTSTKILLIDDDETLLDLLAAQIRQAGYSPLKANNGKKGLIIAKEEGPNLIILDVMMPQMDGWAVCRQIREDSRVPIIMLTAKGEEVDKLRGFHLGVDDYVTKPFSFAELIARVGAVLVRSRRQEETGNKVSRGEIMIDFEVRQVEVDGEIIDLTPTEYRLLETLAQHAGRTIPFESLLEEVWGSEYAGERVHVKHYIWALRQKLEADPGAPKHILTERGFGYRFE